MTPETGPPEAKPGTPAGRSSLAGGVVGAALVIAVLGGVIGGAVATQPRMAAPAAAVPVSPTPTPTPTALEAATPTPPPTPTASRTPVPVATSAPAQTPTPATTPTASPTPAQVASPPPAASTRLVTRPVNQVDAGWLDLVSGLTGVPRRALEAYASATLTLQQEKASCSLGWNTLAAIGQIESRHGSFGGSKLGADGVVSPRVIGPALDGKGYASIRDTDGGSLDGDSTWDRAVGPMQFIPSTWRGYGADGNGDGVKDPHNIDDAALAAARYLCARGGMDSAGGWRSAVIGYNRSEEYIAQVARVANDYAKKVAG